MISKTPSPGCARVAARCWDRCRLRAVISSPPATTRRARRSLSINFWAIRAIRARGELILPPGWQEAIRGHDAQVLHDPRRLPDVGRERGADRGQVFVPDDAKAVPRE